MAAYWREVNRPLCDYIAASTLTHCNDGWAYLAQALNAELKGDPNVSRHLAYYAELRAAMSLLASEGIGIFNNRHVVLTSAAKCRVVPPKSGRDRWQDGTHQFTWDTMELLAGAATGKAALLRSIKPGGTELADWFDQYGSVNWLTQSWLTHWGLDLQRLASDRRARNLTTYRPTAFTSPEPTHVGDTLEMCEQLWRMCEPRRDGGFPVLDRHLLRRGLALLFENAHGKPPDKAPVVYERSIDRMLHHLSPGKDLSPTQWRNFLLFSDDPDDPKILADAVRADAPDHAEHSKQVLARALLLLRIASGSIADLLDDLPNPLSDLRFWWESASIRRTLWPEGSAPSAFSNLWQDVRDAIDDVTAWYTGAAATACHHRLWTEQSTAASVITTTNRVALWGFEL